MQLAERIVRVIFAPVVLACAAASSYYAFEYGQIRAGDPSIALYLGGAAAALDLLKCGLPILGSYTSNRLQQVAAMYGFAVLTIFSLWCAMSLNAAQLADKIGAKAQATTARSDAEGTLSRLRDERKTLPAFDFATDDSIQAAKDAVKAAEDAIKQECGKVGENCRKRQADATQRRAELSKTIRDKAATDQAKDLDHQIKDAEIIASKVDVKTAVKSADPMSDSMAKVLNVSTDTIQLVGTIIFALTIEVGSGIGVWLVFHSRPHRIEIIEQVVPKRQLAPQQPVVSGQNHQVVLAPLSSSSDQIRDRFFNQCLIPASGHRVSGSALFAVYERWCRDNGHEPMNIHAFGREAPWEKRKISGVIYYLDARVIEAYAERSLRVVADNSSEPRLGKMVSVGR